MNKLWLIIKREYLVRVRKKSFIIITILAPLAFAAFTFGMGFLTEYMSRNSSKKILVKDDSGIFKKYYNSKDTYIYTFSDTPLDELQQTYKSEGYDLLTYIPQYDGKSSSIKVKYYSPKKPGLATIDKIGNSISKSLRDFKIEQSNVDKQLLKQLNVDVSMENALLANSKGDKTGKISLIISTALAFVMGFLLYMVIFIFGTQVMRSVMEEKINRIVEIIISSVKPFQLMLGKVIGVGAVGLTQLFIWIIFIPLILSIAGIIFGNVSHEGGITGIGGMNAGVNTEEIQQFPINLIIHEFFSLNWALILPSFILFFLGGYFLYSSMFAAVGTAIGDDQGESQGLIWPITLPVIFAMIIMFNSIENPDSPLAVFGSIFPLFSPIVMPARLPFDPPVWQVITSLVLLILTCILFIWLSAKIYRSGILLYGKKLTIKDMIKMTFSRS